MLSFKQWKEDLAPFQLQEPEAAQPQISNFRDFVNSWVSGNPIETVYEFVGELAAHPRAGSRREFLDSHENVRSMVQHMSTRDWNEMDRRIEQLPIREQKRMGHALRWLHMNLRERATHYNRRENNLGQYAARFREQLSK